jgi:hypothetical protein
MKTRTLAALVVCLGTMTGCQELGIEDRTPVSPTPGTVVLLTPNTARLDVGAEQQFSAKVNPTDANQTVSWSVSNAAVATISDKGLARCTGAGSTSVIARWTVSGDIKGEASLICEALPPTARLNLIKVTPAAVEVTIKQEIDIFVCALIVENIYRENVAIHLRLTDPALATNVSTATIPPGGRTTVNVFYKGGRLQPFEVLLRIWASIEGGEDELDVPFTIGFRES